MSEAWRLFKVTGEAFAECLRKAWQLYKLSKAMKSGIVQFFFRKVNGEARQAFGSLEEKYFDEIKGTERKKNDLLFTYWDTEKEAFRSFKKMNIISIA
jgi:hypothetical protein